MTIDRTKARATKGTEVMERIGQNNSGAQGSSNSSHQSRKPPGMEDKCMRCGKQEHQPGQKCPAKNAKCKACHKTGHFHSVCQSKKRANRDPTLFKAPKI